MNHHAQYQKQSSIVFIQYFIYTYHGFEISMEAIMNCYIRTFIVQGILIFLMEKSEPVLIYSNAFFSCKGFAW